VSNVTFDVLARSVVLFTNENDRSCLLFGLGDLAIRATPQRRPQLSESDLRPVAEPTLIPDRAAIVRVELRLKLDHGPVGPAGARGTYDA
jgi:hypothetical protein